MNSILINNEYKIYDNLIEFEEYYLIKDNNAYKIIVGKRRNEIIIKCKNYETKLYNNNLPVIIKSKFNSIDEAYDYIINIFNENKAKIKYILIKKEIKLILELCIYNKEKNIEIILLYKKNKNCIIDEINKSFSKIYNNIIELRKEIKSLNKESHELKVKNNKSHQNEKTSLIINDSQKKVDENKSIDKTKNKDIISKDTKEKIEIKSNPKDIQYYEDITEDSYSYYYLDNTFSIFNSINNISYLIYSIKKKSIISYNLKSNSIISEIKNAHNEPISNFRYYLDIINKRDLIISISSYDNNIKLWNFYNWECLLNIKNVNKNGYLNSACIFTNIKYNFIITSNFTWFDKSESIKIFDLEGNKIKEINDSKDNTVFIDIYYDKKLSKNYIITGNIGHIKSYDYNQNKLYYKYSESNKDTKIHYSVIAHESEQMVKLIESSGDGNIRIWNFHSGNLLKKINVSDYYRLYGLCLWDNEYLFVGCEDKKIRIIEINKGVIIKNLIGHNNSILTMKKIIHPLYGESLISQAYESDKIKLWINKK